MANKIALASVAIAISILIVAAVYFLGLVATPSPDTSQLKALTDLADFNWAGYTVAQSFSEPKPVVTGVSGSWVVPQVQISQTDTYSAIWVGIGGFFGHSLIQIGTEQDTIGGKAHYFAWYELLPGPSVQILAMAISPGDEITASISLDNTLLNLWLVQVADLTTGERFSQYFIYNSSRYSAEWVVERPDVNNALSALADFGNVTMKNCNATVDNEVGSFGHFPSIRISMYGMDGIKLANVSSYSSDGSTFDVRYLAPK